MIECWRWFGPDDPTLLSDLPQVGATGVVTALHAFVPGEAWPAAAIAERKAMIEAAELTWEVVESLPVSEAIKTQGADMAAHLAAYKTSMEALAEAGVRTICYNFMPILDWTRTQTHARLPHGGTAMLFDLAQFAAFDLFLLKRAEAVDDYSVEVQEAAKAALAAMDDATQERLTRTVIAGLPGANDGWTLDDVRARLDTYRGIEADDLRRHLIDFLSEVVPVAERLGLRLCCHPDDPPFSLLGLPRVMSSTDDYQAVLDAVDTLANGATLCTGSLGVAEGFDGADFVRRLGPRIHFAHLRNTKRLRSPDPTRPGFFEAAHLEGDTDMVATISALMQEEARRLAEGREDHAIPMRPDHGQELLMDRDRDSLPGYPLIGRMRGLAELRGVMAAVASGQA
ncbi:mannonate dehydratase [Tateyamaria sp. ANG-S1]|uniref:mannonate dehydratase n=1 Tax=Tateyamaria sp. ANG-S1 TaxID=1577905 RepID=UPI00057FE69B|nr:mannonate dehydratase [Tateyamaria sp. ANG-S1]KIC50155.1 mannonate dehydratase [Tateyamaria sp. ANG-S1]